MFTDYSKLKSYIVVIYLFIFIIFFGGVELCVVTKKHVMVLEKKNHQLFLFGSQI